MSQKTTPTQKQENNQNPDIWKIIEQTIKKRNSLIDVLAKKRKAKQVEHEEENRYIDGGGTLPPAGENQQLQQLQKKLKAFSKEDVFNFLSQDEYARFSFYPSGNCKSLTNYSKDFKDKLSKIIYYDSNQKIVKEYIDYKKNMSVVKDKQGHLIEFLEFKNGKLVEKKRTNKEGRELSVFLDKKDETAPHFRGFDHWIFNSEGEQVFQSVYNEKNKKYETFLTGKNGIIITTFDRISQIHPKIQTAEDYLQFLADNLTEKMFASYLKGMMQYTDDDNDNKYDPRTFWEKLTTTIDYAQTPEQTIGNIDSHTGKNMGDCDDYAGLAVDFWRRQGKTAYRMEIPRHAFAINIETTENGLYTAKTFGTFGYDINGERLSEKSDEPKVTGFPTIKEAINSILKKYNKSGLGRKKEGEEKIFLGEEDNTITLTQQFGVRPFAIKVPINILTDQEKVDSFLKKQYEDLMRRISILEKKIK